MSDQTSGGAPKTSRRSLLKRVVLGLGAAALLQPRGGVLAAQNEGTGKKGGKKKKQHGSGGGATHKKHKGNKK